MKRSTFIHMLTGIKMVFNSNNVTVVENFNNKALVIIRTPEIVVHGQKENRLLRKVFSYSSYYNIRPEVENLVINLEFHLS